MFRVTFHVVEHPQIALITVIAFGGKEKLNFMVTPHVESSNNARFMIEKISKETTV